MQNGDEITVTIRSMGSSGEGVGVHDGQVVFIDDALIGEQVTARVSLVKKNYAKAELQEIVQPSDQRVVPPCPYFGTCGGCQLQHMTYAGQLAVKRERVTQAFSRIGGFADVSVDACVPSPKEFHYRNKIQLPLIYDADGVQLGLYSRGTHDIVPIERCLIHCELGEKVFQKIAKLTPPTNGRIRYVLIKSAVNRNEALVVLVTTGLDRAWLAEFADCLMRAVPEVKGVVENVNTRDTNVVLGSAFNAVMGRPWLEEELMGKRFSISAHSFFQVNTDQAAAIYKKCLELAALDKGQTFVDAYCGVGSLSLIASDYAGEVIGIECVPHAVDDAVRNAELNGVTNARFICGLAEKKLSSLKKMDVLFLNPPRKGCDKVLLETVLKSAPPRIVYMSCNPETLARDAKILSAGYIIESITPFDMFPQTTHVETVALFTRCSTRYHD